MAGKATEVFMTQFKWAEGARVPIDAQVAGERLEQLESVAGGPVTPKQVVDDARPEDAPLHPVFEWDNGKAAELYREEQARHVIRSVRIVVQQETEEQPAKAVRAFVNVVDGSGRQGYMPTIKALSDNDLREQVLRNAWGEIQSWRERYRELQELTGIHKAIDDVQQSLHLTAG